MSAEPASHATLDDILQQHHSAQQEVVNVDEPHTQLVLFALAAASLPSTAAMCRKSWPTRQCTSSRVARPRWKG